MAGCPSCHPTNSVKALKKTQSTDPDQWPGVILSSSNAGLPRDEALLLSGDSTNYQLLFMNQA